MSRKDVIELLSKQLNFKYCFTCLFTGSPDEIKLGLDGFTIPKKKVFFPYEFVSSVAKNSDVIWDENPASWKYYD